LPTPRTTGTKPPPELRVLGAYSIKSFCASHGGMSEAMFHKMCAAGEGPAVMAIGRRRAISVEAAAKWRAQREAAAKKSNEAKQETAEVA
jgi:hypothetical protein